MEPLLGAGRVPPRPPRPPAPPTTGGWRRPPGGEPWQPPVRSRRTYLAEVRAELHKVAWPTTLEVRANSAVVLTALLAVLLLVGAADLSATGLARAIGLG